MRAALATACVLVACSVPPVPLEGKRCAADHPCVEGFVCNPEGLCVSASSEDAGDARDAGGSSDAGPVIAPPSGLCSVDGWCFEEAVQRCELTGVALQAPNHVVAVGAGGTVLRRTDAGWSYDTSPTRKRLNSVYAFTPNELWAVGEGATVLRLRDAGWEPTTIPGATGDLTSVFGDSAVDGGNLFVGSATGQLLRFNGSGWTSFDAGVNRPIRQGYCPGPNDCWMAGAGGLIHYNGALSFTAAPAPMWGVWGSRPNDVWAVGEQGTLLRFNGAAWASADAGIQANLRAVWGASPNEVWAGSDRGLFAFDGGTWASQSSPLFFSWPNAFAGASSRDVWAVATVGGAAHFDGGRWAKESSDEAEFFTDVFALSPTDAWLFGGFFGVIRRWDGRRWSNVPLPGPASGVLAGWASGEADAVAVRRAGDILRWDGIRWSVVFGGNGRQLLGVWGSSKDDVWAVGDEGTVIHWSGGAWSYVTPPDFTTHLRDVWGSGPSDVWMVGTGGALWHWDGSSLTAATSGTSQELVTLAGTSATDVWAGGVDVLLHLGSSGWAPVTGWTGRRVAGAFALAPDDAYAVTSGGELFHWTGATWKREETGTTCLNLTAVHGSSRETLWVVGSSGTILRRKQ